MERLTDDDVDRARSTAIGDNHAVEAEFAGGDDEHVAFVNDRELLTRAFDELVALRAREV